MVDEGLRHNPAFVVSSLGDRAASEWADERRAESAGQMAKRIETVLNEQDTPASLFR